MTNQEKALAFVRGELSLDARSAVASERLYHKDLDAAINAASKAQSALDMAGEHPVDAPNIWASLQGAIAAEQSALSGKPVEEFVDGQWEPHGPGIEFKQLWQEGTILIRCVPGGVEEAHDQPDDQVEHIVVIAGDLNVGGRVFETGAYLAIPAGSTHPRMSSKGGCILFTQYLAA